MRTAPLVGLLLLGACGDDPAGPSPATRLLLERSDTLEQYLDTAEIRLSVPSNRVLVFVLRSEDWIGVRAYPQGDEWFFGSGIGARYAPSITGDVRLVLSASRSGSDEPFAFDFEAWAVDPRPEGADAGLEPGDQRSSVLSAPLDIDTYELVLSAPTRVSLEVTANGTAVVEGRIVDESFNSFIVQADPGTTAATEVVELPAGTYTVTVRQTHSYDEFETDSGYELHVAVSM